MKEEVVAIDHSTLNILPMCQPMVNHQWSIINGGMVNGKSSMGEWSMVNHQWSMANASSVSDDFSAKGSESYAG